MKGKRVLAVLLALSMILSGYVANVQSSAHGLADGSAQAALMPAQSMSASTEEMDVHVSWDANIFPAEVAMVARAASQEEVMAAAQEMVGDGRTVVDAVGVDISFYISSEDGRRVEIQPQDPSGVHVSLSAKRAVRGETHEVVHIGESGVATHVIDAQPQEAAFDSVGFSVYAIIGSEAEEETARRTYIFKRPANNSADWAQGEEEWDRQVVKNGDQLVEPGTPSIPGEPDLYFAGWYDAKTGGNRLAFGPVSGIPENADQEVVYYARYEEKYFVRFLDDEGDVEREVIGAPGATVSMNVDIPGLDERGYRLVGWSETEGGARAYALADTYTITDADKVFYPVLVGVRKAQFFENADDATYTRPVYAAPGEEIPAVAAPTRMGYTFTGWYLDADCTQAFGMLTDGTTVMPAGDGPLQLYAGWAANDVEYTVYVWGEVMDPDGEPYPEGDSNRYAVKAEWTGRAPAGHRFTVEEATAEFRTQIANTDNLVDETFDTRFYEVVSDLGQVAQDTVVKGDGSTIVNLYFDLKPFTFVFHNASAPASNPRWRVNTIHGEAQTTYTFTAKLGQNITDLWPDFTYTLTGTNSSRYAVFGWRISPTISGTDTAPGQSASNFITHRHRFTTDIVYMVGNEPQATTNFWPHGATSSAAAVTLTAIYMERVQDGIEYPAGARRRTYRGNEYVEMPEYTQTLIYSSTSFNARKTIAGYEYLGWEADTDRTVRYYHYNPSRYSIIFHNYNTEATVSDIAYRADISEFASRVPGREETGLPDYYTFEGWYTDRQHTNRYTFEGAQASMPPSTLTLYAYWKPKNVTITFDANGGTLNGETTVTQVIEADTNAADPGDPVREGYTFLGWGKEGEAADIVDFSQRRFTEDTTLVARWSLDQAEFSVVYTDEFPTHAVPTDSARYRFGSGIILKKSPASGDTHTFHGWKIQGYGDTVYLPGQVVVLNDEAMAPGGVITFVAYHGTDGDHEELEPVAITYHSNFPDGAAEQTAVQDTDADGDPLMRNVAVAALGADTFSCGGWRLIGWNTQANGEGLAVGLGMEIFADHIGSNDLYGVWSPADVTVRVEHYKQALDGTYPAEPSDVDTFDAAVGTTQNGTPKSYDGFTYRADHPDGVPTGVVSASGLVLKLFYERNANYTLTYEYIGTVPTGVQYPTPNPVTGLKFGQDVTISVTPYRAGDKLNGYTFQGWQKVSGSDLVISGGSFIMPSRNVVLDGTWTANTDTPYTVRIWEQKIENDEYANVQTDDLTGTTGTEVNLAVDVPEGFTYRADLSNPSGTILGDGSLVLNLYFDRKTYTVRYEYTNYSALTGAGGAAAPTDAEVAAKVETYKYKAPVAPFFSDDVITVNPVNGYTFSGWSTTRYGKTFEMPDVDGDVIFYGTFNHIEDTSYVVEHYKQQIDPATNEPGSFTLEESETIEHVAAGSEAAYTQKTYEGYSFKNVQYMHVSGPASTEIDSHTKVRGDGTTIVRVYYTPNKYKVNYQYNNTTPGATPEPTQAELDAEWDAEYYYGATVSPKGPDPVASGYTFSGWKHSATGTEAGFNEGDAPFTMPARDVTIRGSWTAQTARYEIHVFLQNLSDDNYTEDPDRMRVLTDHVTGDFVTADPASITGFTYNPDPANPVTGFEPASTGTVQGDGSLKLNLYYDRNEHTVTYQYVGYDALTAGGGAASPTDTDLAAITETYRYGAPVTPSAPASVIAVNPFDGWNESAWTTERFGQSFDMPDDDVIFYKSSRTTSTRTTASSTGCRT
ncbi:MAG: InlB B-repeat-containing protein [Lachnospiraceae bacterium]|nr:InlB B-repeat-containing protein [Lachnospiraceae bacterium]